MAETAPGGSDGAVCLLEAGPADAADGVSPLELFLKSGERLRIGNGVDLATLRAVLDTLRA